MLNIACHEVFIQSIWAGGRIYMHAEKCLSFVVSVAEKAAGCFEKAKKLIGLPLGSASISVY